MPLRFPGQYADRETNLNYNYFRDYDTALGRYTRSDPVGLRAGLNTYSYVKSKPLMRKDPKGLEDFVDDMTGTYNINPPPSCPYDDTTCNNNGDVSDVIHPTVACVVRKIVIDQIEGLPVEIAKEKIMEKVKEIARRGIKITCKWTVKIVSVVWDVHNAYVIYKECTECPENSCPVP